MAREEAQATAGADQDAAAKRGPYELNDSAGRELVECARSGISITPDNFLEYAKIRSLRKGLISKPDKDIFREYPFLTGSSQFQSGIGHKLTSDFQDCYETVCGIINLSRQDRKSSGDEPARLTAVAMEYLNGKRAVRTWRTLWMAPKPATTGDKIALVRLLRRLHAYSIEREDAGFEHLREALKTLIGMIPDELTYPGMHNR